MDLGSLGSRVTLEQARKDADDLFEAAPAAELLVAVRIAGGYYLHAEADHGGRFVPLAFEATLPEGVDFATRITNAGYRWSGAGENIAKGQRTPQDVMTSWMNSSGHKANILNCKFKNIGVGVAADTRGSLACPAARQASRAIPAERSRSSLSQVKPSPMVHHSTPRRRQTASSPTSSQRRAPTWTAPRCGSSRTTSA